MVERKMLAYFSPLRLLFGWKALDHPGFSGVKKENKTRPEDEAFIAPETNYAIMVEHYKHLGRGPL